MKKSKIFLTGLTLALLSSGALAGGQAQAAGRDSPAKPAAEKAEKASDSASEDHFDVYLRILSLNGQRPQLIKAGSVPATFVNGLAPIPSKQLAAIARQKARSLGYQDDDVNPVDSTLYVIPGPVSTSRFYNQSMADIFPISPHQSIYFQIKVHVQETGQVLTSKKYHLTKTALGNLMDQDFINHFRSAGRYFANADGLAVVKELLRKNNVTNYKEPIVWDVNLSKLAEAAPNSTVTFDVNVAPGTAQPSKPSNPAQPSKPADAGNQGQTSQPSEPNEPSQPAGSGQTAAPTTPTNPGKSNQNDQNEQLMSGIVFLPKMLNKGDTPVQLYDGQGNPSGQSLKPVTYWKVFASKIIKGQVYYRLGTDKQWIPAKLVMTTDRQPASQAKEIPMKGVLRISYRGRGKVKLTDQNGKYLPNKQSTFVANGAAFKIFARKVINGRTYYRLGTEHQWLPDQYMQKR